MENKNLVFPIYNDDGTSFHNLTLKKSTFSRVVMSLDDKIEGDIYYPDNSLSFSFKEYIIYKNIKFYLKADTPPTIVRKGMASDNSELSGMSKYSLTFYHPMILLYNLPFFDVAVTEGEKTYKTENTTFYWIGTLTQLVTKINKCLENTLWSCLLQPSFTDDGTMSDVIQFQDNKISDVLKTAYETFNVPYTNDGYSVLFGKPSNEIYAVSGDTEPYIFRMGQGLGLKNNDRTPKNNEIITRLAGYGSEDNIPSGYPKIKWTGDQTWGYTINNDMTLSGSYSIIDGIIDGENVKLINHPFTRDKLMPTIYVESVNKKVNPFATGYDKDILLVDYYDAVDDTTHVFTNQINPQMPSYDKHQFEDVKPTLKGAKYNGQDIDILRYISPCNSNGEVVEYWDDGTDTDGNYNQSYFKVGFYPLGFDLYAMAAFTSAMQVVMTGGACNGCSFELGVDWDVVKTNFYVTDEDGTVTFSPKGAQRNYTVFPDSTNSAIDVIVKKDTNTFGTLMPNIYMYPITGDKFVFLGIEMPQAYITQSQNVLDEEMKQYLKENNIAYFEYPFDFDEYFLETHSYILSQINTNSILRFEYDNEILALSIKEYSITWGDNALPTYKITLTDDVSITLNSIGKIGDDLSKLGAQVAQLQAYYGKDVIKEINNKLSKVDNDTAKGIITFLQGLKSAGLALFSDGAQFGNFVKSLFSGSGAGIDNKGNGEFESIRVRSYFEAVEFIVNRLSAIEGDQLLTEADTIESVDDLGDNCYGLHLRSKWDGYFTAQSVNNVLKGIINTLSSGSGTYYTGWYRVNSVNTVTNYIEVTEYGDEDVPAGTNYPPIAMMKIARWGNQTDTQRQDCLYFSSTEGRIVKLTNVTKPIIDKTNYGMVLGTLPDFLKALDLPVREGRDYAYVPGLITTDIIRIDYQGDPIAEYVDRGIWTAGDYYFCKTLNPTTGIYEISDVWYNGCKYRCQKDGTVTAPAWNNTDWAMLEGNPDFTIDFVEADNLYDPDNFYATLTIMAKLYNIDITSDISDSDIGWSRYSEDANGVERIMSDITWALRRGGSGKAISLTIEDCDLNGYMPKTIKFTATATLRDGVTATATFEYN